MRAVLQALTDELRRLRASGVKTVTVTDESLLLLQTAVRARAAAEPRPTPAPAAAAEPRSSRAAAESAARPAGGVAASPAAATARPAEPTPRRTEGATAPPVPDVGDAPVKPAVEALPPAPVFTLPDGSKEERMRWLRERVMRDPVCLARVRPGKKVVVGVGNLNARVFFCGEAPGAEEEVYIGNILNWRPELPTPPGAEQMGNRPPTPEEMTYCLPFLRAQLEIVAPEVIVALGSTAAQGLFGVGSFKTLGEIRGRWRSFGEKPVMVTYHPSYILRNGSNRSKRAIWEDLLQVMERLALPITDRQRGYFLDR
jgi:uracil-DNA glycosylase